MINAIGKVAFAFIIACLSAQYWPFLPDNRQLLFLFAAGLLVIFLCYHQTIKRRSYIRGLSPFFTGLLLGGVWMASVGHSYLLWQLPSDKFKQTVIVTATVLQFTEQQHIKKLELHISELDSQTVNFKAKVSAYYFAKKFHKKQTVRLCLKLKPSHGLQNPGGFDYWKWLVSKQIKATGYVKKCEYNVLVRPNLSLQTRLKYRLTEIKPKSEKWLKAMLLADRDNLTSKDWALLQKTGVAHLFTLSGLHMGVVFIFCLWAVKLLIFSMYLVCGKQTGVRFAIGTQVCALIASWAFVSLCNYPLTLVRACLALTLFVMLKASHASVNLANGVKWVLVACLIISPFSVYGISLYLSFFAVAVLVLLGWRFSFDMSSLYLRAKSAVALQFYLTLFMMFATGIVFGVIHWSSFLVNLIAIPFVTLIIVPFGCLCLLLLTLIPSLAPLPIRLLGELLHYFIQLLNNIPTVSSQIDWPIEYWFVALILFTLCFVPSVRFRTTFPMAAILIVSVVFSEWVRTKPDWSMHVFDVGQGSALLIESDNQAMLVDTGNGFNPERPLAASVIIPSLHKLGFGFPINGVISHFDADHSGGANWLTENGFVPYWHTIYNDCTAGQQWQLGKLTINVLWPSKEAVAQSTLSKNNLSCVLLVSDGVVNALIPGDIEQEAESAMLIANINLSADILIAPHHGSKSSSTEAWVNAVSPDYVVVQNGFLNRWDLPHKNVMERYKLHNANVYTTAKDGYIRFDINTNETIKNRVQVQTWFTDFQQRWYKTFHSR